MESKKGGENFRVWLREQMAARSMSGGMLARALSVGSPTVYKWLNGDSTPASLQIPRIAQVFGVSEDTVRDLLH